MGGFHGSGGIKRAGGSDGQGDGAEGPASPRNGGELGRREVREDQVGGLDEGA